MKRRLFVIDSDQRAARTGRAPSPRTPVERFRDHEENPHARSLVPTQARPPDELDPQLEGRTIERVEKSARSDLGFSRGERTAENVDPEPADDGRGERRFVRHSPGQRGLPSQIELDQERIQRRLRDRRVELLERVCEHFRQGRSKKVGRTSSVVVQRRADGPHSCQTLAQSQQPRGLERRKLEGLRSMRDQICDVISPSYSVGRHGPDRAGLRAFRGKTTGAANGTRR